MKNLLALAAAAVLIFAGVGWYLGWYQLNSSKNEDGTHNIHIGVNSPKISEDLEKGKERLRQFLDKDQDNQGTNQVTNQTPNNSNQTNVTANSQSNQQNNNEPVFFETSEDGFFILPENYSQNKAKQNSNQTGWGLFPKNQNQNQNQTGWGLFPKNK